jgi:hypothetical protein
MVKLFIERTTLLAIIIPMAALVLVGFISYENTTLFIQKDAVDDAINSIVQRLESLVSSIRHAETGQTI